jgi:hypothetical protein
MPAAWALGVHLLFKSLRFAGNVGPDLQLSDDAAIPQLLAILDAGFGFAKGPHLRRWRRRGCCGWREQSALHQQSDRHEGDNRDDEIAGNKQRWRHQPHSPAIALGH